MSQRITVTSGVGEEIAHEINAMLAGELNKRSRLEGTVVVSESARAPDMKHARVVRQHAGAAAKSRPTRSKRWNTRRVTLAVRSSNGSSCGACRTALYAGLSQEQWNASSSSYRDMKKDKPSSNLDLYL